MELIKSVYNTDNELIKAIMSLYNIKKFCLDPTYSKGVFWKNLPQPIYKADLVPQYKDVIKSDVKDLPDEIIDKLDNICFDPPFMFGHHGQTKNNIMNKRFSMFDKWEDLEIMYKNAIKSFYILLNKGGLVAFKCQDYTDSKTTMTHCFVWKWAVEQGFYAKDIFIMATNSGRIYNPKLKQRHARKFHSYWWIFQK